MSLTKADRRIIQLNDAMGLIHDAIKKPQYASVLRTALRQLGEVKASLIQNLDHDRKRLGKL